MSKINTVEEAIKLLETLKGFATDIDDYEDDLSDDYRQIARVSSRELIDTLLELEISDELMQSTENNVSKADNNKVIVDFSKLPDEVLDEYGIQEFDSYADVFYWTYLDDDEFSPHSLIEMLGDKSIPEFIDNEPYLYKCNDKYYRWTDGETLMNELAEKYPNAVVGAVDSVLEDVVANEKDEEGVSEDKDIPPSLDELVREYEHFAEVTKDICTIEQAMDFQKTFRIPVEINGVPVDEYVAGGGDDTSIEWIRYEFFGHLWYIYDRFDGEPTFDIYYGKYGDDLFAEEVSINDLKEGFSELVEDCVMFCLSNGNYESLKNAGETFGFTVPGGKHHIFVSLEKFNDDPNLHYVVEPNRIVDGGCEPMGNTVFACFGDDDDLRKAIHWCLEQFEEDKEVSLDTVLDDAKDRVVEGASGVTGKEDIVKD